jgi:16S rRNA processing protein RimM
VKVIDKMFDVGKIVNTHGVRGEVRVIRITDFEERFRIGERLYLVSDREPVRELIIDGHRKHKQFDLLHFEGLDNINDVEHFKGAHLKINEDQLTELNEGEYYHYEIIDCEMFTTNGDKIGTVIDILSPGANDVWVVKRTKGKDVLIPFIKDVVKKIDVSEKKIIIELMEGLLD